MKKLIPLLLLVFILSGCGVNNKQRVGETMDKPITFEQITMEEAKTVLDEESGYILLDVRTKEEYAEGHIKNAINIPNENISKDEISELPDKGQKIYVYCRSGNRSKQAAEKLVNLGYTNVTEIGGIKDWSGEIVTE